MTVTAGLSPEFGAVFFLKTPGWVEVWTALSLILLSDWLPVLQFKYSVFKITPGPNGLGVKFECEK